MTDLQLQGQQPERPTLDGVLDWYRGVAVHKVQGLSEPDARRLMTPSGMSPLGIVQHLAWAERLWFRLRFAGDDLPGVEMVTGDNSPTFALADDATVASIVAEYEDECERSRAITAAAPSLDEVAVSEHWLFGIVSLRWILVHMIEETARHVGHLDLMREQIDGVTGD